MSVALFSLVIDVSAMVCTVLYGAGVVMSDRRSPSAWLIGGLCLSAVCNGLLARQEFSVFDPAALRIEVSDWASILNLVRNTAPGLFMILVHRLFVDDRPLPRVLWVAFGLQLVLELLVYRHPQSPLNAAPALLELMFGSLALYWTLASWPADLIETRRRARVLVFVLLTVNMVASSLLLRLILNGGVASYNAHIALSIFGLATIIVLLVRSMRVEIDSVLAPARKANVITPYLRPSPDDLTLGALERLIAEQIFLEPRLSLKSLADRVGAPEYRLRRVIHERLGHRNFNAFLHSLRIGEACRQLDDPGVSRTPLLTIVLSVGYNSANTFNRGFREVMGCTPSQYRTRTVGEHKAPEPEKSGQILQSA